MWESEFWEKAGPHLTIRSLGVSGSWGATLVSEGGVIAAAACACALIPESSAFYTHHFLP